ncbi:DoxX family protein [Nocardia cyriacigeorgica]|uniref:DoxX family protein n=1 Tax=Nocardia cyriacigeorgica TaxID=135487 RepID=UPI002B4B30EA|nr:DoxX family protein [Nocardia cyriacigeorgica]
MTSTREPATSSVQAASWHPATLFAFRFCVVYFGLFCLLIPYIVFALLGPFGRWVQGHAGLWATSMTDAVTGWVGARVFGVEAVLHKDSGAGDQTATWVLVFCLLVAAVVAAAVWTAVDPRSSHPKLLAWFTLFLRLCLAGQMLSFGLAKLIPNQMPAPGLTQLLQPYGSFSPMSVLWLQVGSSPAYEMTLGAAEVAAGLLLLLPRTAILGAAVSLASTAQILVLNMTFDVPEKLLSAHLLLISLVLLAPYLRRLFDLFVRQRACAPLTPPALFTDPRKNRIATWSLVALAFWVTVSGVQDNWRVWQQQHGAASPRSPLYGIWDVRDFVLDGRPVAPLTTDENRWQRVVFDDPEEAAFQRMNGDLVSAHAAFRTDGLLELTMLAVDEQVEYRAPFATLSSEQPAPDRLILRGTLHDRPVAITLDRVDPTTFTLRSRGFHWVQDYPYLR